MANVIGIPRVKGNSESMRGVKLFRDPSTAYSAYFEGQAVFGSEAAEDTVYPTFGANQGSGNLIGFICDINRANGFATLVRAGEDVVLPAVANHGLVAGDNVTIDLTTGKIDSASALTPRYTNGFVSRVQGLDGRDGKTGAAVADCVMVRFGALEDLGTGA